MERGDFGVRTRDLYSEMSEYCVGFNGTSTEFRSLAPSVIRKAGTESPTVKESRRYINLANAI